MYDDVGGFAPGTQATGRILGKLDYRATEWLVLVGDFRYLSSIIEQRFHG